MLVDENRVSIRIDHDEAGRTCGALVRFAHELHAVRPELALQLAHVGEAREWLGVAVPARVEGQNVLLEHALEEADDVIAALQDQPVLRRVAGEVPEAEPLIELPRRLQVLHGQADRECAELHDLLRRYSWVFEAALNDWQHALSRRRGRPPRRRPGYRPASVR